jgi:cytochrome bd ubiquinol oxidase subunit II
MDLHLFWFMTLGILLTGYAILDGFDLGVGILHLCVKKDEDRRILMNAIGPLWDGNEVWLVTFGGALFAAFPDVYATVFSGFYVPFMLLLFALIFRGISMEFRSKLDSRAWRQFWDVCFFSASLVAALLFGVAVGNAMSGMPIGADKEFHGCLMDLLRPYPLLVGCFTVALLAMHGSLYLYLKTEGQLQSRIQHWMWTSFGVFLVLYIITTMITLFYVPEAARHLRKSPVLWFVVILNVLAIANIPRAIYLGKPGYAFFSSCCTVAALTFLFGVALLPNLVVSNLQEAWNLTIYNSASSEKTLSIMRTVAFLGMPFVLAYTATIYWVFRNKVDLGSLHY